MRFFLLIPQRELSTMKRALLLALGLLAAPMVASAQVEIGLDAGLTFEKITDVDDAAIGIGLPLSGARVGFAAGDQLIVETRLGFGWEKQGDASATSLDLMPGVNFLFGEGLYVRGEAGLSYFSFDTGTSDGSSTQYVFGAGVGMRRSLGGGALLRLEAGVDRLLENEDDGIPSSWLIGATVGVSAVIN
jgi:hypothetical protein